MRWLCAATTGYFTDEFSRSCLAVVLTTLPEGSTSKLSDFKVIDDDVDIRGWQVVSREGRNVGEVTDLLVDTRLMVADYIEVAHAKNNLRHMILPLRAPGGNCLPTRANSKPSGLCSRRFATRRMFSLAQGRVLGVVSGQPSLYECIRGAPLDTAVVLQHAHDTLSIASGLPGATVQDKTHQNIADPQQCE